MVSKTPRSKPLVAKPRVANRAAQGIGAGSIAVALLVSGCGDNGRPPQVAPPPQPVMPQAPPGPPPESSSPAQTSSPPPQTPPPQAPPQPKK